MSNEVNFKADVDVEIGLVSFDVDGDEVVVSVWGDDGRREAAICDEGTTFEGDLDDLNFDFQEEALIAYKEAYGRSKSDSEALEIDVDSLETTLYYARNLGCSLATVGTRTLVITEGFGYAAIRYLLTESETAELDEKLETAWVERGSSDWDWTVIRIVREFLAENRESAR